MADYGAVPTRTVSALVGPRRCLASPPLRAQRRKRVQCRLWPTPLGHVPPNGPGPELPHDPVEDRLVLQPLPPRDDSGRSGKRDNALCDPGPDTTAPNQPDCRPGCGNAAEARLKVATWITGFCNTRRPHSVCGYRSPIDYEHNHRANSALELAA